ncbi:hypothetical protein JKP88DRAFT_347744 [Tribonema minus]|uniref:Uncharacterized protein n=1 Tax=Tribonema minus TaxID=303371 RepID=A0A836CJQ1_9STRA|nr:hypothetical protein JKP88DRAFT_347744 [Tribonema minus]
MLVLVFTGCLKRVSQVCTIALVFTGCLKTRKADPKKTWHPLHDFLHTMLNTFATGVLGPLFVGEIPLILTNDLNFTLLAIIPLILTNDLDFTLLGVVWMIFYRRVNRNCGTCDQLQAARAHGVDSRRGFPVCPGTEFDKTMVKFASRLGVYQVLVFFSTLSRANNVCVFTDKAYKRLLNHPGAGVYYPIPLLGPIIVGTIRGAGGNVFPPDKGLGALASAFPFNAQIALICSAVWHLAVNDTHIAGGRVRAALARAAGGGGAVTPTALRCAIVALFLVMNVIQYLARGGGGAVTRTALRCAIVALFLVMNVIQSFPRFSTFNPFTPIWEVVYLVSGIPRAPIKPGKGKAKSKTSKLVKSLLSAARGLGVMGLAAFAVWSYVPRSTLRSGEFLKQGEFLGWCTLLPELRGCQPTIAVVEATGRLAVYRGKSPGAKSNTLLWSSAAADEPPAAATSKDGWVAALAADGTLTLKDGAAAEEARWRSAPADAAPLSAWGADAARAAVGPDGVSVLISVKAWSSAPSQ